MTSSMTLPQKTLVLLIRLYQVSLGLLLGGRCRFHPSCSEYTRQAVARHGAGRGLGLGLGRLLRCHPWCAGGYDPVPGAKQPVGGLMAKQVVASGIEPRAEALAEPKAKSRASTIEEGGAAAHNG